MEGESINIISEQIEKLKQLFPETISEGKIDWEKLQATLWKENIEFLNERYVLNWAGKSEAFKVLQQSTTATLKPVPGESVILKLLKMSLLKAKTSKFSKYSRNHTTQK